MGTARKYYYFWKWVLIRETDVGDDKTKRRIEKRQCKCGRKFKNSQSLDVHKKQCSVKNRYFG